MNLKELTPWAVIGLVAFLFVCLLLGTQYFVPDHLTPREAPRAEKIDASRFTDSAQVLARAARPIVGHAASVQLAAH